MMNNIIKKSDSNLQWGEDPHHVLQIAQKSKSNELVIAAEEAILRQYRLRLRNEFECNEKVTKIVEQYSPVIQAQEELSSLFSGIRNDSTVDLFNQALSELLHDLEEQRKKPGSIYLVDTDTGETSIAISPQHIYQPPDFVGEDGKIHKSKPILHPGISAPIILDRHEKASIATIISKGGSKYQQALQHLKDPDSIRTKAIDILKLNGITFTESDGKELTIEFGHEHVSGPIQSLNPRFHRTEVLGQILAKKITAELNNSELSFIGDVKPKSNSKKRWYEVKILTRS